jgi:predicted dehydrogenase
MADMLKATVIGTGAISKEHLNFLSKYPKASLVGVCDLSPIAASYAAERYSAANSFTDYWQMLSDTSPDIVHILTPPKTHKAIATDCLRAGAHVICEKPITLSFNDFKDLWEVSRECNRVLIEDQNYRFNSPILNIQKLIKDGALGEVQEVEIRLVLDVRSGGRFDDENFPNPVHRLPAGVIHDFITHMSYLVLCFIPDLELNRVSACWSNHGGGDLFKFDDLDALLIDSFRHVRLRFSCNTLPETFTVVVRGSKGFAETDLFQPYLRTVLPRSVGKQLTPLVNHFATGKEFLTATVRNFRNKVMQETPYHGLHSFMEATYEAILNQEMPPIGFEEMSRTVRLVDTLLEDRNLR